LWWSWCLIFCLLHQFNTVIKARYSSLTVSFFFRVYLLLNDVSGSQDSKKCSPEHCWQARLLGFLPQKLYGFLEQQWLYFALWSELKLYLCCNLLSFNLQYCIFYLQFFYLQSSLLVLFVVVPEIC
jgi:hypothetical protein